MSNQKYDLIVIGSGIGGLTTASLLAHKGYRVLVTEKMPIIGGRSGVVDHHGIKLPTGLAMMSDEIHGDVCRKVGVEFDLQEPKSLYYVRIDGEEHEIANMGIFRALIGLCAHDEAEGEKVIKGFKRGLMWAEPSRSFSFKDWLDQYTDNPRLHGAFNFFATMDTALNHFELPAGEFFRFIKETHFVKKMGGLPLAGGSFTGALAKAIKRDGGEIWTRSRALQIKMNGQKQATSVVVQRDGAAVEVEAPTIVCNAGPKTTVKLVGESNLDPGHLADVARLKGAPQIVIFVVSDHSLIGDKFSMAFPLARRLCTVLNLSSVSPGLAPKGKHILECAGFFTNSDPPYDFKKEVDLTLQDLRENIEGFDKYGKVLRINCYHGDWGIMRTWAGYSLPIHTPIEGLYNVGDANAPLGWWGSSAAVKSGLLAVEDISHRYKPA